MKKAFLLILALVIIFSCVGCSDFKNNNDKKSDQATNESQDDPSKDSGQDKDDIHQSIPDLNMATLISLVDIYGLDISWDTFSPYYYFEKINTEGCVRRYPVSREFTFIIQGPGLDVAPTKFLLALNENENVCIDVRTSNINEFINTPIVDGLVTGTYYLPYQNIYGPIAITFRKNGKCIVSFSKPDKSPYECNYWIKDGKVYMDISETSAKVHVFTISDHALIFDPELSTANLWDAMAHEGPVVYFLPNVTEEQILSICAMVAKELDNDPNVEIYSKYSFEYIKGENNYAYAFLLGGDESAPAWSERVLGTDYTFTYSDGSEVLVYFRGLVMSLNVAVDRGLIAEEIIDQINENHHDCEIAHSYDDGVISEIDGGAGILYTCRICQATKTATLPDDFAFTLTYRHDLKYDSATGHLENGYNYPLDTVCETTLILDHDELMNIYRILYNGKLFDITEDIYLGSMVMSPTYTIKISYTLNGETVCFAIHYATDLTYSEWDGFIELGYAYFKVVNDFILSSEEYKSMPPNTNIYD